MKTFIQPGETFSAVAPTGGIVSGVGLKVGAALWGIATHDAAENASVELYAKPGAIVTIAKTSALAITRGDRLYWDATNKVVNKTSANQLCVGVANADAANPSATVEMRIGGVQPDSAT